MRKYEPALYEQIKSFSKQNRISFHMPVHGGGRLYGEDFCKHLMQTDLTELDATDNLIAPSGAIAKTHENMARLFGADNAHMLVGGSSAGICAMIMSVLRSGDCLLVDRCVHISVINACVMYGIEAVFIDREIDDEYMITRPLSVDALKDAIKKYPHAKAVLITSPTYYGVCSPIEKIAKIARDSNMALLVDCAHGSHFAFSNKLPGLPTALGADMCVLSLHKTLGAPTQSALLLHKSDRVDFAKVKKCLNMVHTTSPSYMLMCAMDVACEKMAQYGEKFAENMIEMTALAKEEITKDTLCKCLCQIGGDIARLVINFSPYDITAYEVADILRDEYKIDIEMADFCNLVCITGPLTTKADVMALAEAIKNITAPLDVARGADKNITFLPIEALEGMREAFFGDSECVDICSAEGRICADTISIYPPGMACLVPGARIGKDEIALLQKALSMGASVTGIDGGKIRIAK